ncbi:MAG: hypothetical protein [Bacteriophage sp.]|nr:MAG: hypothetical protein [Bacteriophage sp.]
MGLFHALVFSLIGLSNISVASTSTESIMQFASYSYLDGNLHLSHAQAREVDCMAKVIFFEARGESKRGKTLVANVVRNRTQFGKPFATELCKVVYQPNQFAWTRDKKKKAISFKEVARKHSKNEQKAVLESVEIALNYVLFQPKSITNATHFCSKGEKCAFKRTDFLGKVGNHSFYLYKGNAS